MSGQCFGSLTPASLRLFAIAGKNAANPVSQILSAAMLLRHCGRASTAEAIEAAVEQAFADGNVVILPSGAPAEGTDAVTQAVIDQLQQ